MSKVLDKKFWAFFVQQNWEKKPILVKNYVSSVQALNSAEIFSWLVEYSNHCRKIKKADGFKFYIDGESQYENEVLQALPVRQDKSLQGYHARMNTIFADYCLVCDELIQVSGPQQMALKKFMYNLYDLVGIPNRRTEIGLYLGNYKKTPFGVHVDGCGVFSFPVEGVKKFRLWTDPYVQKNPDLEMAFDYKKHIKKSTLLRAEKGDMTYWPSKAWHIAESGGDFSATWSLGVWVDQPYFQVLTKALEGLLAKKLNFLAHGNLIRLDQQSNANAQIKKLPKLMRQSVTLVGSVKKQELDDLLMKEWLLINSQNGFSRAIKPNTSRRLKPSDYVIISKDNPVMWSKLKAGKICIAVHGVMWKLPQTKSTLNFIRQLNSGKRFQVAFILKLKTERATLVKILDHLFQTYQLVLA